MLLTTCPPQKCLSIASARLLDRIWCLGRCGSSFPPVQAGSEGSQLWQSCHCPWHCLEMCRIQPWAPEGCSGMGSSWVPLPWAQQPECRFIQLPAAESPSPVYSDSHSLIPAFGSARRHQLLCTSGVWIFLHLEHKEQLQKWGFGAQIKLQLKPCSPSRTSIF